MLPARLLAWYPRSALGSGLLEALIADRDGRIDRRMLKLVRLAASFATACPFCADMNQHRHREVGVSDEELQALRERRDPGEIATLSGLERLAIRYARLVSATPPRFDPDFVEELRAAFDERELVLLASTAAQVNYWARLCEALGVPAAGFGGK
jgi:AhpD family alkylhydroperoxidase